MQEKYSVSLERTAAGKPQPFEYLQGFSSRSTGHGQVLGFDLVSEAGKIRERVGYMSQRLSLYADLSVFENLRFRAQVYGSNRPRAAAKTAIDDFELTEIRSERCGAALRRLGAPASAGSGSNPFAEIDSAR